MNEKNKLFLFYCMLAFVLFDFNAEPTTGHMY